RTCTSG
ncbi:peptidase PmbA, partial [Haemophilus influenzae]